MQQSDPEHRRAFRVLIVEDEGIVARDLEQSLYVLGYTVCGTCATGPEALDHVRRERPDLVLMDIRLRGNMDGIETARRIREHANVAVVFLTAYADPDTLDRAAAVGPYAYVLKPYDERELQVALIMALCKHRAFAELDHKVQERTEELARTQAHCRRLETAAELGLFALETSDCTTLMQKAVSSVAEALDLERVQVLERQPDDTLLERAAAGAAGHAGPVPATPAGAAGTDREIRIGIHGPGPGGESYGLLVARAPEARLFDEDDLSFLTTVASLLAAAVMRVAADTRAQASEHRVREETFRARLAQQELAARDEFLSVASHELRTPVGALDLQLRVIHQLLEPYRASVDGPVFEQVQRAQRTVRTITHLIEQVLDLSRLSLEQLDLQKEEFDLARVVGEVLCGHEELAKRAGCDLRLRAPGAVPGWWDRGRLEQVVSNLLSNAFKFGAGAPVEVTVEGDGDEARLVIRDWGAGLDPADAERILGKFQRAVSHRNYSGLGLGLYVAKQIVEAHGGTIRVDGRPREGAAFAVTLPCRHQRQG